MDSVLLATFAVGAVAVVMAVARSRAREAPVVVQTAHTSAAYFGPAEIEAYVREHATELGRETFPDNAETKWTVHGFTHTDRMVLAEVEPDPADVGYPRFKFGFVGGGPLPPEHVATYCLEDGIYKLLCTSAGAPARLPRRLD